MSRHHYDAVRSSLNRCFNPHVESLQQLQSIVDLSPRFFVLQNVRWSDLLEEPFFGLRWLLNDKANFGKLVGEHCALVLHQEWHVQN